GGVLWVVQIFRSQFRRNLNFATTRVNQLHAPMLEKNNLDLLHHEFLSNRNNRARRSSSRVKQPLPPEQNPYRQITTCSIHGNGITSHGLVQQSVPKGVASFQSIHLSCGRGFKPELVLR
ncbi:MAG: hypothetical protein LBR88_10880, partial [Zoogloeaceae bacterium]|nr:hypothetical protein [Zoogloeaceae bacterium]